jgi:hypothetical protein
MMFENGAEGDLKGIVHVPVSLILVKIPHAGMRGDFHDFWVFIYLQEGHHVHGREALVWTNTSSRTRVFVARERMLVLHLYHKDILLFEFKMHACT